MLDLSCMERELEAKYKSEMMKIFGIALMSPLPMKALSFINQDNFEINPTLLGFFVWFLLTLVFITPVSQCLAEEDISDHRLELPVLKSHLYF